MPRFVSDSEAGEARGQGGDADKALARDELGWTLAYTFSTVCEQFQFDE